MAGDTAAQRLQWLMSAPVQRALVLSLEASAASSLPAERAFAETKRSEAPRLCHVAAAGRNQIIRHYFRQRAELLEQAEAATALMRRVQKLNLQSLAWEARPDLASAPSSEARQFIKDNVLRLRGGELRQRKEAARNAIERTQTTDAPVAKGELMKTAPSLRRALNRRQRKQESAICCIGRACAGAALGGLRCASERPALHLGCARSSDPIR